MIEFIVSEKEYEFIERMRELKLARRSTLLHIREIIESPMVKPQLFEAIYKEDRAKLSMFSRMI